MYPTLFKIGSLYIYSRETFLLFAFIVGALIARRRGLSVRITQKIIIELIICIFFSSLVGARLFYALFNLDWYVVHPKELFLRGGASFYGGLLLSLGVSFLYLYKRGFSFLLMGDIFAPSLAIGETIGRIGCFLGGCCYGKPTALPWGVTFPLSSFPYQHFGDIPLHPTQLYLAMANICIFLLLYRMKPGYEGKTFFSYLILHSAFRFMIEFTNGSSPYILFDLNIPQTIAIFIGMSGVILFSRRVRNN